MIVIFGHDSHYLDYGGFCLWDPAYTKLAEKIKAYCNGKPLLWVLSGGSDVEGSPNRDPGHCPGFSRRLVRKK